MAKANFEDICNVPDPRAYFRALGSLDYQIPAHGGAVFGTIAEEIASGRDRDGVRIADLCCSYGINVAVLKHDTTYLDIVGHCTSDAASDLSPEEVLERDLAFCSVAARHGTGGGRARRLRGGHRLRRSPRGSSTGLGRGPRRDGDPSCALSGS